MKLNKYSTLINFVLLCICITGTTCSKLNAQNSNLSTLSFLQSKNINSRESDRATNESKYQKLKIIYDKLIQSKGDYRNQIPKLILRNKEERVASIDYDKLEIIFEEKAFDVCNKYGDGAIAFLLAHELTHYYEKHAWKNQFAAEFSDLQVGRNLKSVEDQILNETQADYLGGFLCYSAGYLLDHNNEALIKDLYNAYHIDEIIPGYPTLSERIKITKRSIDKLNSMIEVFEMANLLTVIGKYDEAIAYYEFILMRYQSREIYNNLGTVFLLKSLQYFDSKELKYNYPIELDVVPLLSRDDKTIKMRDSFLTDAIHQFDIAIGMDPEYPPSYLNKAIGLTLLDQLNKAQYYCEQECINRSKGSEFRKTALDAEVLKGIIYAKKGESEKAISIFNNSLKQGSTLAKINLEVLENKNNSDQKRMNQNKANQKFSNGMNLEDFSKEPIFDDEKVINISLKYSFLQYSIDSLDYNIYFNHNSDNEENNYFMIAKPTSLSNADHQIHIGSKSSELKEKYGDPMSRIETAQGSILMYNNIFFIIGKDDKITQWGSFLSKKLS